MDFNKWFRIVLLAECFSLAIPAWKVVPSSVWSDEQHMADEMDWNAFMVLQRESNSLEFKGDYLGSLGKLDSALRIAEIRLGRENYATYEVLMSREECRWILELTAKEQEAIGQMHRLLAHANVSGKRGKISQAILEAKQAREILEKHGWQLRPISLKVQRQLCTYLDVANLPVEAVAENQKCLKLIDALYDTPHPFRVAAQCGLATSLKRTSTFFDSYDHYLEAISTARKLRTINPNDPYNCQVHSLVCTCAGNFLWQLGLYDEALALYGEAESALRNRETSRLFSASVRIVRKISVGGNDRF